MRMRIDEPRHQRLTGKIDNCRIRRSDRRRGYPVDAVASYEDIEAGLQFWRPVEHEVGVFEENIRHTSPHPYVALIIGLAAGIDRIRPHTRCYPQVGPLARPASPTESCARLRV